MANISVTYSFTNGTTADADQITQNFTDIINGTSDGSKDFSINALTVGGTLTANGNVVLGNASGDDVTITGSLSSSIPIKTTNAYNIGSSTIGLASIYLGANSQTVRILPSASMSATYTLTFPTTAGTSGFYLQNGGSGALQWTPADPTVVAATPAATYAIATADQSVHVLTPSEACTVTLSNDFTAGRIITLINLSTAYDITVNANDAAKIFTLYRSSRNQLICQTAAPSTSTSWRVLNQITSPWIDGSSSFAITEGFGMTANKTMKYRRQGKNLIANFVWQNGAVASSIAAIDLPSGLTNDFTNVYGTALQAHKVGTAHNERSGADLAVFAENIGVVMMIDDADTDRIYYSRVVNNNRFETSTGSALFNTSAYVSSVFEVAITEWNDYTG